MAVRLVDAAAPDATLRTEIVDCDPSARFKTYTVEIEISEPRLWWPWDLGGQPLYTVEVRKLARCRGDRGHG